MTSDYEVGYRKPPKKTRFKKGKSGNPKGRPKETRNLKTDLQEELREPITIREGAKQRRISKQRAMVKSALAKAIKGDTGAVNLLCNMILRLFEQNAEKDENDRLSADEQDIFEVLRQRLNRPMDSPSPSSKKKLIRRRRSLPQPKLKQRKQSDA